MAVTSSHYVDVIECSVGHCLNDVSHPVCLSVISMSSELCLCFFFFYLRLPCAQCIVCQCLDSLHDRCYVTRMRVVFHVTPCHLYSMSLVFCVACLKLCVTCTFVPSIISHNMIHLGVLYCIMTWYYDIALLCLFSVHRRSISYHLNHLMVM